MDEERVLNYRNEVARTRSSNLPTDLSLANGGRIYGPSDGSSHSVWYPRTPIDTRATEGRSLSRIQRAIHQGVIYGSGLGLALMTILLVVIR